MHPIFAFGLPHGAEWLYILAIVLLLFGADKIPKLARGLGKSLGEFKKAKEEFEKDVNAAATEQDKKPGAEQPKISGNLPEPVQPVPTSTGATSVDELTKKS
jgi:TatA/E family protein of Tat protein translocase